LDDLREADVLIQVLDASGKTDEKGNTTENYDVKAEVEFLKNEIDMWIFGIIEKNWKSLVRKTTSEGKKLSSALAIQLSGLKIREEDIKSVMAKLELSEKGDAWNDNHILKFAREIRKFSKPIIIAANKCDLKESGENIEMLKDAYPDEMIIPCSADFELALREASKAKLIDYIPGDKDFSIIGDVNENQKTALEKIRENVLKKYGSTGVQNVLNSAVFDFLKCVAVFPAGTTKLKDSKGRTLPDCYIMPKGSTALDFAFKLHTDIGKNFVKAVNVKTKTSVGKDYALKNRDAIEIMTR